MQPAGKIRVAYERSDCTRSRVFPYAGGVWGYRLRPVKDCPGRGIEYPRRLFGADRGFRVPATLAKRRSMAAATCDQGESCGLTRRRPFVENGCFFVENVMVIDQSQARSFLRTNLISVLRRLPGWFRAIGFVEPNDTHLQVPCGRSSRPLVMSTRFKPSSLSH